LVIPLDDKNKPEGIFKQIKKLSLNKNESFESGYK
jgi:hypothetical protein